jgi:hypothetical protein
MTRSIASIKCFKANTSDFPKNFLAFGKNFLAFVENFLALQQTCQLEREHTLILYVRNMLFGPFVDKIAFL